MAGRGIWGSPFQEPAQWRLEHPRNGKAAAAVAAARAAAVDPPEAAAGIAAVAAAPAPPLLPEAATGGASGKEPPSPGCAKENVTARRERIYHMPGGQSYEATRIDTAAGERWFCSEGEAQEAGWRRARS